ncbi:MAG: hypothetical protein FGM15_00720 [Chthoniobacterales bacterium]|nr:hypothetical protein [Chthoniobacterales bacterium]
MLTINTSTLRRALDLQERIEGLQRELSRVLGKNAALSGLVGEVTGLSLPARRGRKPGRKKAAGRKAGRPAKKAAESGRGKKRTSPFKGKKRPSSPSGPLAPAVIKVMKRAGGPMNVDAVLQGLKNNKYVWNVSDPKKNLAARIYTLPGVKKVGPGLFALKK